MGVSSLHHLSLFFSVPLVTDINHFPILALVEEISFQVCDKVSLETPPYYVFSGT